jgi:alkylated DNA repair dioxygenase AlkB
VSWHSDDEPELGINPIIASVSFGQTRRFQLKHKLNKDLDKVEITLTDGSLLLMKGSTQHFWHHQIPKTSKQLKERINLTFRVIKQ